MILQYIMQPFDASISEELDPWFAANRHITTPISHTMTLGLHPVAHKLLLISLPTEGKYKTKLTRAHSLLEVACK